MAYSFLELASTPSVKGAQAKQGSLDFWENFSGDRTFDRLTPAESAFISERDSFYMATVSESGWPYIQHRGGPPGFLKVLDEKTLGFADYRGNRQYISVGNIAVNQNAALILMDYVNRSRLKAFVTAEAVDLSADPKLASRLADPRYKAKPERGILLRLVAFDWNCPQHITPRYTEAQIETAIEPLRQRLTQLEEENAILRAQLKAPSVRPV